jgi:hypothetical protein
VVLAGICAFSAVYGAVAAEADEAPTPPGHLIPESLDNWTITYSSFDYLRKSEFTATFTSAGQMRLHKIYRSTQEWPDLEATLTDDETRTVYQATRDVMNWFRLRVPRRSQTESDSGQSLTLTLDDGRFVSVRMKPSFSPLGTEAQQLAIRAITQKYLARIDGNADASGVPRPATRTPQPFSDGIVPQALGLWSFGIADGHEPYAVGKRAEHGPAIATIWNDPKMYYRLPSGTGGQADFPFDERDQVYALARKIFNGYQLEAKTDKNDASAPRVVLSLASAGVESVRFNVDQETLGRLGTLEEYTRLARIARQLLAKKAVDGRFVLPWETSQEKLAKAYTVWVYERVNGQWVKHDDRTFVGNREDALRYLKDVQLDYPKWTATSNLPGGGMKAEREPMR